MAKTTEKNKVAEITVLTEEQINALPQKTKDDVIFLMEHLPASGLLKLSKLGEELIEMKKLASELKYIEDNKENLQDYKNIKSKVKNFRARLPEVKKELKGPLDAMGKKILSVEKIIKSEADSYLDIIDKTFKPYLDAEAKKKADKEKKKEEERNKAIKEANDAATQAQKLAKRGQLYNDIRYQTIQNKIGRVAMTNCQTFTAAALKEALNKLEALTYSSMLKENGFDDLSPLLEEQKEELQKEFVNERDFALATYRQRINQLEEAQENAINVAKAETKAEVAQSQPAPTPPINTPEPPQQEVKPPVPPIPKEELIHIPNPSSVLAAAETVEKQFPQVIGSPPNNLEVTKPESLEPLSDTEFVDYIYNKTKDIKKLLDNRVYQDSAQAEKARKINVMYGKMIAYCETQLNLK